MLWLHEKYLDVLLYDKNILSSSLEMFGDLRKSLAIFGKCSETFIWPSDNFWRMEIFEKCAENFKNCSTSYQEI